MIEFEGVDHISKHSIAKHAYLEWKASGDPIEHLWALAEQEAEKIRQVWEPFCWWCGKTPVDEVSFGWCMSSEDRDTGRFSRIEFIVPRCRECAEHHQYEQERWRCQLKDELYPRDGSDVERELAWYKLKRDNDQIRGYIKDAVQYGDYPMFGYLVGMGYHLGEPHLWPSHLRV